MWRCPNCDTLNNEEEFCYLCGKPRGGAIVFPVPPPGSEKGKKRGGGGVGNNVVIIVAIVCAVVVIAAVGILFYFLSGDRSDSDNDSGGSGTEVETVTPVVTADPEPVEEPTVYYVNRHANSGIFVRSGPSKNYSKILYIAKGDVSVRLKYLNYKELGSDGYYWYNVEIPGGQTGYVREDVVREG